MLDIASEEIIKSAIKTSFDLLGARIKAINDQLVKKKIENSDSNNGRLKLLVEAELKISEEEVISHVSDHVQSIVKWSEKINFKDLRESKKLSDIYIELDTYVMPSNTHFSVSEQSNKVPIDSIMDAHHEHTILLGQPGAGKTTSIKKFCASLCGQQNIYQYTFPVLIRLRELNSATENVSILKELKEIFKFAIEYENDDPKNLTNDTKELVTNELLINILENVRPAIFLDGLDEVRLSSDRNRILAEVAYLASNLENAKLVVTCRTGEFEANIDNTKTLEISPLTSHQIIMFARHWFSDDKVSTNFLLDLKNSLFDKVAVKPITLAHLCAIYERIERIPEKPKTVLNKIVNLLIDEWDTQRSVVRISKYSRFESDRKFEFLCNLAFSLTVANTGFVYSLADLEKSYKEIHKNFGLPSDQVSDVVRELESHTGLLIQSGYKSYEFSHKLVQEYLSAEYIVRLPNFRPLIYVVNLLAAELAVATSISSNSGKYLCALIFELLTPSQVGISYFNTFISRLIQEKPDIYPDGDVNLALFVLLAKSSGNLQLSNFLFNELKVDASHTLYSYYSIDAKRESDSVLMRKRLEHDIYTLPDKISIPSRFIS